MLRAVKNVRGQQHMTNRMLYRDLPKVIKTLLGGEKDLVDISDEARMK